MKREYKMPKTTGSIEIPLTPQQQRLVDGDAFTRTKIGTEYFRSGYGRGLRKANVYLIDNYAFAKDASTSNSEPFPLTGEFKGYVRVNLIGRCWFQCSGEYSVDRHEPVACPVK